MIAYATKVVLEGKRSQASEVQGSWTAASDGRGRTFWCVTLFFFTTLLLVATSICFCSTVRARAAVFFCFFLLSLHFLLATKLVRLDIPTRPRV